MRLGESPPRFDLQLFAEGETGAIVETAIKAGAAEAKAEEALDQTEQLAAQLDQHEEDDQAEKDRREAEEAWLNQRIDMLREGIDERINAAVAAAVSESEVRLMAAVEEVQATWQRKEPEVVVAALEEEPEAAPIVVDSPALTPRRASWISRVFLDPR